MLFMSKYMINMSFIFDFDRLAPFGASDVEYFNWLHLTFGSYSKIQTLLQPKSSEVIFQTHLFMSRYLTNISKSQPTIATQLLPYPRCVVFSSSTLLKSAFISHVTLWTFCTIQKHVLCGMVLSPYRGNIPSACDGVFFNRTKKIYGVFVARCSSFIP